MRGGLNLNNVEYLYLLDLNLVGGAPLPTNASGNNLLHFDHADHVLLHGLSVLGPECVNDTCNNLQEVLKVNQAQYLYVEGQRVRRRVAFHGGLFRGPVRPLPKTAACTLPGSGACTSRVVRPT